MGKADKFIEIIRQHNIEPRIIYDVGAFDGAQSVELSTAFPKATIYAFEPDIQNATVCHQNTSQFTNIHLIAVAVSIFDGIAEFHKSVGQNRECGSLLKPNNKYPDPMPTEQIMVPCVQLKHFPAPEVIWMDVQGTEVNALSSANMEQVKAVWLEVNYQPYYVNQVLELDVHRFMERLGFARVHESVGVPGWFGDACYLRT